MLQPSVDSVRYNTRGGREGQEEKERVHFISHRTNAYCNPKHDQPQNGFLLYSPSTHRICKKRKKPSARDRYKEEHELHKKIDNISGLVEREEIFTLKG